MEYSFDIWEAVIRVIKYAFEGLIVALVAFILPKSRLQWSEIWLIALTAAAVFSVLDLLAPSISAGTRQGVGLGTGFRLVGFPGGL
jgi:hypothetical protein